jgi:hypothetical protein
VNSRGRDPSIQPDCFVPVRLPLAGRPLSSPRSQRRGTVTTTTQPSVTVAGSIGRKLSSGAVGFAPSSDRGRSGHLVRPGQPHRTERGQDDVGANRRLREFRPHRRHHSIQGAEDFHQQHRGEQTVMLTEGSACVGCAGRARGHRVHPFAQLRPGVYGHAPHGPKGRLLDPEYDGGRGQPGHGLEGPVLGGSPTTPSGDDRALLDPGPGRGQRADERCRHRQGGPKRAGVACKRAARGPVGYLAEEVG